MDVIKNLTNLYGLVTCKAPNPTNPQGPARGLFRTHRYLTVLKLRIVFETRRNRPRIVRNPCVPVCGYHAGYFGLGWAQL